VQSSARSVSESALENGVGVKELWCKKSKENKKKKGRK